MMFTVGEFSRLARVSKRLLRYYDEIGLLKPSRIERSSGYRYYSAEQMPRLNRILALKELGLSLEQIQRMLSDQVSTDEMQGMLLMKKAEIEQQLQAELQRIRSIEARLQFLRSAEADDPFDVVVKSIPAQPALSVRGIYASLDEGLGLFGQIAAVLPERSAYGQFFAMLHSDGIDESDFDVEVGCTITAKTRNPITLKSGMALEFRELPAVETMATSIVKGPSANLLIGYSMIGTWAEANGYRFAGVPREVAIQMPQRADWSDAIAEIQFPVALIR
jgi:DNA-binding transcriptional MerR regulator